MKSREYYAILDRKMLNTVRLVKRRMIRFLLICKFSQLPIDPSFEEERKEGRKSFHEIVGKEKKEKTDLYRVSWFIACRRIVFD